MSEEWFGWSEGHGKPCHYCGEPCSSLAGNPGLWPLPFAHREDPGVVKWHHTHCVTRRLDETEQLRLQKTGLEALLCDGQADIAALKHDIARHVEICSQQAEEIERLRARVAALEQSS